MIEVGDKEKERGRDGHEKKEIQNTGQEDRQCGWGGGEEMQIKSDQVGV